MVSNKEVLIKFTDNSSQYISATYYQPLDSFVTFYEENDMGKFDRIESYHSSTILSIKEIR